MENITFADTLIKGLNNPDCSFFVGTFIGQIITFKLIFFLIGVYLVFKVVEKLVLDPILAWLKKKVFDKRGGA